MNDLRSYAYLVLCLSLAVVSQIIMKWQLGKAGPSPAGLQGIAAYMLEFLLNPWVIAAAFATFFAGVAWLLAISRLDLSHAYPFVGLLFVIMLVVGCTLFDEPLNWQKVGGALLIAAGVALSSRG
jgi:drug/metabolite transporter (DMT)-like permease